ncbi:unnamed protein product [Camellia sinensis]
MIPASTLATHPLVLTALFSLNSDILSEASVNVISELIHYTAARNSGGVSAQMPLIQVIVPQVMSLKSQLRDSSKQRENRMTENKAYRKRRHRRKIKERFRVETKDDLSVDEEDVKAIARLFADMGDSYLELIASELRIFCRVSEVLPSLVKTTFFLGSDESMLIVHALLEVALYPECDIASMTFNFWHNLQINLIERDSYIPFGHEASKEAERNRRLLVFRSSYELLVSLVSFRVQYPHDYADLSKEDLKDFKQTRYVVLSYLTCFHWNAELISYKFSVLQTLIKSVMLLDVADLLIDAALVLGGEATLKILYVKLVEAVGSCGNDGHSDWRPVEAALYCIRAISDYVSVTQAEVMPQLCLTIGAYSKWLDAAPSGLSFLPPLIDILVSGMSMSADTAGAAALAFGHICNGRRVRTSKRFMGITIGAMLEEIQGLYKQHHQPCFLYLSSEVIKIFGSDPSCADYLKILIESLFSHTICLLTRIQDFTSRPDIVDDCFLLASRCIRYCPHMFFPSAIFPPLVDCSMIGITVQHRGEKHLPTRDNVIMPRGATITRILVASLTGALPSSRLETVIYALLLLTRAYGLRALEWAKDSVSLIPSTAVTDMERTRFLGALSDVASGVDINPLTIPIEELSEVCRRNRTVQEIVQGALRPHELNTVAVSYIKKRDTMNNNNNKGSTRSNNKKSLYEKSMKMVSNILKLSSFSSAKMTLGGTPSLKTTPPPPSPLSQLPGTQMAREPSNSSKPVSYVTEPFEGNDGSSLHVIHEENGIDGDASKYIKRVHDKYRYDLSEGSTLSPNIFPPPPRRGHVMY